MGLFAERTVEEMETTTHRSRRMGRHATPMALAIILVVAACGGDGADTTTTIDGAATTVPSETTTTLAPTTSSTPPTTTTSPSTTTTTQPATTTTEASGLPGEPIDIGPAEGDVLAVIGVAHDDVLNLREIPGTAGRILLEIGPLVDELTALGNARLLPRSIWYEVEYAGSEGWVNSSFVAYLGEVADTTASLIASLGETPSAPTMDALGALIGEHVAGESQSATVTVTVAATVADLGEITLDVVGLEDDALRGVRLHVFATPTDGGFTLKSVEQTLLCGRGVADGLCV